MSFLSVLFLSLFFFISSPFSFISCQSLPVICQPGSYYSTSTQQCLACPLGHYQDYDGQTDCKPCPRDMYADKEGLNQCERCQTGYYAPGTGYEQCKLCGAGSYIEPGMAFQRLSICLPCPPGTYSMAGASSCINCAANMYSNKEGSIECSICPEGLYSLPGSTVCSADISPNSNNGQIGQGNNNNKGGMISSLSTNNIIAIVAGSVSGLLLFIFIGFMIRRYRQKQTDIAKNRLMIEQTKRSSLNRSSFSQSTNTNTEREEENIHV